MSTQHEDIQRGENLRHVRAEAGKDELVRDSKRVETSLYMRVVLAVERYHRVIADDQEADLRMSHCHQRRGCSERVVVLLRVDPGDHSHQGSAFRNAKLLPYLGYRFCAERLRGVDRIIEDSRLRVGNLQSELLSRSLRHKDVPVDRHKTKPVPKRYR